MGSTHVKSFWVPRLVCSEPPQFMYAPVYASLYAFLYVPRIPPCQPCML